MNHISALHQEKLLSPSNFENKKQNKKLFFKKKKFKFLFSFPYSNSYWRTKASKSLSLFLWFSFLKSNKFACSANKLVSNISPLAVDCFEGPSEVLLSHSFITLERVSAIAGTNLLSRHSSLPSSRKKGAELFLLAFLEKREWVREGERERSVKTDKHG